MDLQQDTVTQNATHADVMRCVVDDSGEVIFSSPALSWQLGSSTSEVLSRPIGKIIQVIAGDFLSPQKLQKFIQVFMKQLCNAKGVIL